MRTFQEFLKLKENQMPGQQQPVVQQQPMQQQKPNPQVQQTLATVGQYLNDPNFANQLNRLIQTTKQKQPQPQQQQVQGQQQPVQQQQIK